MAESVNREGNVILRCPRRSARLGPSHEGEGVFVDCHIVISIITHSKSKACKNELNGTMHAVDSFAVSSWPWCETPGAVNECTADVR
jgi:hypothetical protein